MISDEQRKELWIKKIGNKIKINKTMKAGKIKITTLIEFSNLNLPLDFRLKLSKNELEKWKYATKIKIPKRTIKDKFNKLMRI